MVRLTHAISVLNVLCHTMIAVGLTGLKVQTTLCFYIWEQRPIAGEFLMSLTEVHSTISNSVQWLSMFLLKKLPTLIISFCQWKPFLQSTFMIENYY